MLTQNLIDNRNKKNRLKRFGLLAFIVLFAGALGAVAFFTYDDSGSSKQEVKAGKGTLPSEWLIKYFGTDNINDPLIGGIDGDPDNDVLSNQQEYFFGTDPINADTDKDGQFDGAEVAFNSNPKGNGEIYSTNVAQEVSDRFMAQNDLPELKQENIEKQVNELLGIKSLDDIEIDLQNTGDFRTTPDNSKETLNKYLEESKTIINELKRDDVAFSNAFATSDPNQLNIIIGEIYGTIDKLNRLTVPQGFVTYHKLQVAAIKAAARILEIQKGIDPSADMDGYKKELQDQYYQVMVMQKINQIFVTEFAKLKEQYGIDVNNQ